MFRIARRRFGETTYWKTGPVSHFTQFYDEARCYKSRSSAKGVVTRMFNEGFLGPNDDVYVIGPDRIPPWL